MTTPQRSALLDLCRAIRAVKHGPSEIHLRADLLVAKLDPIAALRAKWGL